MTTKVLVRNGSMEPSRGFFGTIFKPIVSWYIPTSRAKSEMAERRLLAVGNLLVSNYPEEIMSDKDSIEFKGDMTRASIHNVYIDDSNFIRTLVVSGNNSNTSSFELESKQDADDTSPEKKEWLVLAHGFGNGLGFFFKNYHELSKIPDTNVVGIDWLGMGLSSRSKFEVDKKLPIKQQVHQAEDYFVESLEKWRAEMNIEKMTLLGHSFGGYMSSLYALKYPQRINKLILESPVGLQRTPEGLDKFLETGNFDLIDVEKIQENLNELKSNTSDTSSANELEIIARERNLLFAERFKSIKPTYKTLGKLAIKTWNNYISPQSLVRAAGRFGPGIINKYVEHFGPLTEEERAGLGKYMYHVSAQPEGSERSICVILKALAFGRDPLLDRLDKLKVPTYFIYGEKDWMDFKTGYDLHLKLKPKSDIFRVPDAGHNMQLDNPDAFNSLIKKIVTEK
ncbi:hypothetical protein BB560_001828 [Smittium megazygosporum]|uniref:AB hydrolase-1 domain-containing protein n=1 Tax=Smittium megazygosporum TaxID=133381 RepID=A0A2T9ZGI0_9FUNG|nr:hypothetical protein BB560_001828 [Smittium megazygosporum]